MSVQVTIPRIARKRQVVLAATVLAAAVAAVALVLATGSGGRQAPSVPVGAPSPASQSARTEHAVDLIMSLTPARLAAGALGSSYALPTARTGPTLESVLASMSPKTRRYTEAIMSLTFEELAAGAGGNP